MYQGNLQEALQRFHEALKTFQQLNEPASEAVFWHQIGNAHQNAKQWEPAEKAYREAARIHENQGNLQGAASTWNNLAIVTTLAGKPDEAEGWFRKAIEGSKSVEDWLRVSRALNNLADILQNCPNRLDEARQLAEESLGIKKTLDPGAAEIWKTYNILAKNADKQNRPDDAREFRRQAREARIGFAGTAHELKQLEPIINAVVMAAQGHEEAREAVKEVQKQIREIDELRVLADVIDRILDGERDGERDEEVLVEPLGDIDAAIVYAILEKV